MTDYRAIVTTAYEMHRKRCGRPLPALSDAARDAIAAKADALGTHPLAIVSAIDLISAGLRDVKNGRMPV